MADQRNLGSGSGGSGTATLSVSVQGTLTPGTSIASAFPTLYMANSPLSAGPVTLGAAGFTALTVPTGARVCVIIPPTGNTQALTLKGVTGDTGIVLDPNGASIISVSSPSIGIANAGSQIISRVEWY